MNKPIKENWTTGDISGFGFAFSLVAGTGPLVIGLTVIAFLRHPSNMRRARMRSVRNAQGNAARWANPKPEFKIR